VLALAKSNLSTEEIINRCEKRYHFLSKEDAAVANYKKQMNNVTTYEQKTQIKVKFFQSFDSPIVAERLFESMMVGTYVPEEEWRTIPGNVGYQVSSLGRFRRRRKVDGLVWIINTYPKTRYSKKGVANRTVYAIKLALKEYIASRVVASAFVGKKSVECTIVVPINGNNADIRAVNLKWITKHEIATGTGYYPDRAKRVAYKDESGSKTVFRSARNCAINLNASYQTILDICNKKTKKPMFNVRFID